MKRADGYCAIVALTHCSGLPEAQVLDMCQWHGFKDNGEGMGVDEWPMAADDLGIHRRAVRPPHGNVGQFLKKHPRGLYLVTVNQHIFTVLNGGIVYHPAQDVLVGKRRKVVAAWRVLKL